MVLPDMPIPRQYDHPARIPVIEQVLSDIEIRNRCGLFAGGCAFYIDEGNKRKCLIILPAGSRRYVAWYRRHEVAHCNGWPADHPRK